jgi:hypothetical protein
LEKVEFSLADGSAVIKRLRMLQAFRWIPQKVTYQIALAVSIAWLPLLVLTAYQGAALGDTVQVPFLVDMVQYARFFVALPCAIALGQYVNPRLASVLNSFLKGNIVREDDCPRFEAAILQAKALRSSIVVELIILALVFLYMSLRLHRESSSDISSWHYARQGASISATAADWWFLWVSMPLLLFAWFLWAWRLGVWAYLLFRISRLDLRVVATHPDCTGGLGFIQVGMRRFSVLVFAISCILCASIGEEIVFNGATLRSYELDLAVFFLICLAVILGPLMIFTPTLIRSKLAYWGRYGPFAGNYVQRFDDKWGQADYRRQSPLGSPDIQSLADLRHSYAGISEMRIVLPNRTTVGIFAIAYAAPVIPLLATVISVRQVLSEVYSLLLK